MTAFKAGDRVLVLDEAISGKVLNTQGATVTIETEDGFALSFEAHELIHLKSKTDLKENLLHHDINSALSEKEDYKPKKSVRTKPKARFEPTMEVDLHIHQLTKSTKNMGNYDMLSLQLDTAKHKLEYAMKNRIQKIVFIHGVGEGVLKMELEYLFNRYDNLKYYDANYQKYGVGATEVYIYQNPK